MQFKTIRANSSGSSEPAGPSDNIADAAANTLPVDTQYAVAGAMIASGRSHHQQQLDGVTIGGFGDGWEQLERSFALFASASATVPAPAVPAPPPQAALADTPPADAPAVPAPAPVPEVPTPAAAGDSSPAELLARELAKIGCVQSTSQKPFKFKGFVVLTCEVDGSVSGFDGLVSELTELVSLDTIATCT